MLSIDYGLLVSAYKDGLNNKLVYVLTNLSEQHIQIDLGENDDVMVYTTSAGKDLMFSIQKANKVNVPERSVITIVSK